MFLNKVDKPYYEQTTDTVTIKAVKVVIQHGMTVWDIAETGTGMPEEEWQTIFDLNFDLLKNRLEYKIRNGKSVPWIWIYPGEVLNLPSYYAGKSPYFWTMGKTSVQTKYAKTKKILYTIGDTRKPGGVKLSQRQLDSLGVTGSKSIVTPVKHPEVQPIHDREENSSSFGWLWTIIKWILAILLLLFVIGLAIILLFGGFRRFLEFFESDEDHQNNNDDDDDGDGNGGNNINNANGGGNNTNGDGDGDSGNNNQNTNNNGNGGCGACQQNQQPVVDVVDLLEQLQKTGGKVKLDNVEIEIPTPPPADEPTTPTPPSKE